MVPIPGGIGIIIIINYPPCVSVNTIGFETVSSLVAVAAASYTRAASLPLFITRMADRRGSRLADRRGSRSSEAAARYRTIVFSSSVVKVFGTVKGDPICFLSSFTALQSLL